MLPIEHGVHFRFVLVVGATISSNPRSHSVTGSHGAWPTITLYFPVAQSEHLRSAIMEGAVLSYLPTGQSETGRQEELPTIDLNVSPCRQAAQVESAVMVAFNTG